jgi:ubiquinone biosynthesis protein UbiJ
MKAKQLFEEVLPRILREKPERARELGGVMGFVLEGEGGGTWTVDPRTKPPGVVTGLAGGVMCTLTADVSDFEAMLAEPKAVLRLYQEGKIRIEGEASLASSFHRLFA